jgi:predicted nuclease of predicted toxin-antitoxin system
VEYAREKGFVVVTLDADFHAIIAVENASTPPVIRIRREGMKAHALAQDSLGLFFEETSYYFNNRSFRLLSVQSGTIGVKSMSCS